MGLFALPIYDDPLENVEAAEANLKIFWEHPEQKNEYLLEFAIYCLQVACEQYGVIYDVKCIKRSEKSDSTENQSSNL